MADKKRKKDSNRDELEDYARQIWLAGLGAYTRLGKEGGKLFEALIREGEEAEKLASKVSLDGARAKVEKARRKLADKFGDWEERVDKRLQETAERMGLASQADLEALGTRVDELARMVEKLATPTATRPSTARKPAAARKPSAADSAGTATATAKAAPRRRTTAPKAATRGKTSPAPATDAAPGTPPEL